MASKKKKSSRHHWISFEREDGLLCLPSWKETDHYEPLDGGYIINGALHARIQEHVDADIINVGETVFIHPDTMRHCNIRINQPVLITDYRRKVIATGKAWPVKSLDIHRVGVNKPLLYRINNDINMLLIIQSLPSSFKIQNIKELNLVLRSDSPADIITNDSFKHYILVKQEGTVVSTGGILMIPFHGMEFIFGIDSLTLSSSQYDDIDVSSLSLNDSSTPVKTLSSTLTSSPSVSSPLPVTSRSLPVTSPLPVPFPPLFSSPLPVPFPPLEGTVGRVTLSTNINIINRSTPPLSPPPLSPPPPPFPSLADIGGCKETVQVLKELIQYPFQYPSLITKGKMSFPRGIILYGLSGTGKTLLAEAVCSELSFMKVKVINSCDVIGDGVQGVRSLLKELESKSINILIVNDIDKVCCNDDAVLSAFVRHFEAVAMLPPVPHTVVVATTSSLSSVHIELRRSGKFEREIEVIPPSVAEREEIMTLMLRGLPHSLSEEEIRRISLLTHGYVGADIKNLCLRAQQSLLRGIDPGLLSDLSINFNAMERSLREVQPTAMREVIVEVPKVLWSDIGGEDDIKRELREATDWPIKHPQALGRMGLRPVRGILLYGPPGCSKTMIVRALATETCFNFISIKGPEIFNKWVGDSEKAIRQVFNRARAAAPAIIFFDEIDSIGGHRQSGNEGSKVGDRVLTQLLTEIDGVEYLNGVLIIAATNRPDIIDKALLRPGRFDKKIYVPLPNETTRKEIFKIRFKKTPVGEDVDIDELTIRTERYSGAEVVAVIERAAELALSEDINSSCVCKRHLDKSIIETRPETSDKLLLVYESFNNNNN